MMINWKEIPEKYPKVFNLIIREYPGTHLEITNIGEDYHSLGYYITDGVHAVKILQIIPDRFLYEFFDRNWLHISLIVDELRENFHTYKCIIGNETLSSFTTRTGAESQAFEKAFEILEQML
jgi:hypothetical protein